MKQIILFLYKFWRYIVENKKSLSGTNLNPEKINIISAYIVIHSGRKICIVILTDYGSETYPYTEELEADLLVLLKIKFLEEKDFVINDLIDFYEKNQEFISFSKKYFTKKENPEP